MAYRALTNDERADRGRKLADALESLQAEERNQEMAKKAMKARVDSLRSDVSRLKTEVRSGQEWVEDQPALPLGEKP